MNKTLFYMLLLSVNATAHALNWNDLKFLYAIPSKLVQRVFFDYTVHKISNLTNQVDVEHEKKVLANQIELIKLKNQYAKCVLANLDCPAKCAELHALMAALEKESSPS